MAGGEGISPQHALGAQPEVAVGAEVGAVPALVEHLLAGFGAFRSVAFVSWQPIRVRFELVMGVFLQVSFSKVFLLQVELERKHRASNST